MIEVPSWQMEKLSSEESNMAVFALEDVKAAEEKWLDALEALLPAKATIRYLVRYIDTETGVQPKSISKKIKYALNIGKIKNEVEDARVKYKKLKEESKSLYDAEAAAKEVIEREEFVFANIAYQEDEWEVLGFTDQCKKDREKHVENIIGNYINEIEKRK